MKTENDGIKSLYIIWFGQLVSLFGTGMTRFVLLIWAYQQTNQAMTLGWLGFFGYVPYILASPFAGVLIDRWDRKKILVVSDALAGFITIFLLVQFLNGSLSIASILIAEALTSIFEAFQNPTFNASITLLVKKKHYVKANSLFSIANDAARIFSPIIGAFILSISDLGTVFLIDVITFLIAMATLLWIKIPNAHQSQKTGLTKSTWIHENQIAINFIRKRKGLLYLLFLYLNVNFLASLTYFCVLPAMILARSGGNEITLSLVQAFLGIGGLIGGIILSIWGGPKQKVLAYLISFGASFLIGDFLFAVGQNRTVWIIAAFMSSIFIPFINSSNLAIWQEKTPPEIQGRVFSLRSMGQTAVMPLGYLLGGYFADNLFEPLFKTNNIIANLFSPFLGEGNGTGMAFMFLITCVFGFLTAVLGYMNPRVRHVESELPDIDFAPAD